MASAIDLAALQMMCDALGDGVILFDDGDRVVLVNDTVHRLLAVRPGALDGLSTHNVMMSYLHVPSELAPRLRAGECVGCPGPDGVPETFYAQLVTLPAGRLGETISVIVIRDRSIAHQLRRTEDALFGMAPRSTNVVELGTDRRVRMLDHRGILRDLSREVRRSKRDGEQLSIMVLHALRGITREDFETALERTLRRGDRAGVLDGHASDIGDPDAQTLVNLVDLVNVAPSEPDEGHRALLVLPGTGSPGLSAVSLRLRTDLMADVREIACGGATLRVGVGWGQVDQDDAQSLLERAMRACDRDAAELRADRCAPREAIDDVESTWVGPREDLAA